MRSVEARTRPWRRASPAGCRQLEDERPFGRGAASLNASSRARASFARVDLLVCPPATLVAALRRRRAARRVAIGGQDCHAEPSGAFTGDISAEMLKDAGASAVIVGHSERRAIPPRDRCGGACQGAGGAPRRALRHRLRRRDPRRARSRPGARRRWRAARRLAARRRDGANLVVAYEPVWAIGTGLTPTASDVAEMHGFIRQRLGDALRRRRAGHPHPLRRLGEALERQGADGGRRMSMARWSAARASRPTSFWRSLAFTANFERRGFS